MDSTMNTPALDPKAGLTGKQLSLHPFCRVCGWLKGGIAFWSGGACKCGRSAPTFRDLLARN